jgi:hypothetical protein
MGTLTIRIDSEVEQALVYLTSEGSHVLGLLVRPFSMPNTLAAGHGYGPKLRHYVTIPRTSPPHAN